MGDFFDLLLPMLDKAHGHLAEVTFFVVSWGTWRIVGSIERLNLNIAVIVSRIDNHEKRLDNLEK